ncbi:RraA family protein [Halotalea alkalilenta]|uniref:Putative 4-hydroxy-4-methyl-2-oxoglutarate aldolase n=1 Tax=Halotalea alkalilenta TaxID=376489 RepID=A0A172YGF5_9GAMM|nr:RraA family protein [Halotalea alkalilenta]ANF58294.1 hypothetical protein A5892_13120 [Halotalea alkalilenta]
MTERNDQWLGRLAKLESGQVSDVLDEAGIPCHALSAELFALSPGKRFAGRAATLRGEPILNARTVSPALPVETMESITFPGSILVIASGGYRTGALLGGFVAYSLQRAGCQAVVTDGAIRDAEEIRALGLPCVQSALTPVNGARRWRAVAAGIPVTLPGSGGGLVQVAPGDYILGDGDGVVVVPQQMIASVVEDAEELLRIERVIGDELRAGGERAEVFRANPRFAHVRPVTGPSC